MRKLVSSILLGTTLAACGDPAGVDSVAPSRERKDPPRLSRLLPTLQRAQGAQAAVSSPGHLYYLILQHRTTGDRAVWGMDGTTAPMQATPLPWDQPIWSMVAAADFTEDGNPDILFQHTTSGERGWWVLDGIRWTDWNWTRTEDPAWVMVDAGDMTGDNKPDILVQHRITGARAVWEMNGRTFVRSIPIVNESPDWSMVGLGDFDSDSQLDIIVQNTVTGSRSLWLMNGTAVRTRLGLSSEHPDWQMSAVHDADGDWDPDILLTHRTSGMRGWWLMDERIYTGWAALGTVDPEWEIVGTMPIPGRAPGGFTIQSVESPLGVFTPVRINSRGDIAGSVKTAAGAILPFVWRGGPQHLPLGSFESGMATSINAAGVTVGIATQGGATSFVRWPTPTSQPEVIGAVPAAAALPYALINDAGRIELDDRSRERLDDLNAVGEALYRDPIMQTIALYRNGTMVRNYYMPRLFPVSLNDYAHATAHEYVGTTAEHPVIFNALTGRRFSLRGVMSTKHPMWLSNARVVLGVHLATANAPEYILYAGGTVSTLASRIAPTDAAAWTLDRMFDMNDAHQIVGFAIDQNRIRRTVLLTPAN